MDPSASALVDPVTGVPSYEVLALLVLGLAVLGIIVLNRQLTVRRLRQSERAFRDLYDNISEGVFRSTLDGRMISANPYLVRLNGFDSEAEMLREVNDIAGAVVRRPEPPRRDPRDAPREGQGHRHRLGGLSLPHARADLDRGEHAPGSRRAQTNAPLYYDGTVREVTEMVRRLELQRRYDKIASGDLGVHLPAPAASRTGKDRCPMPARA